MSRIEFLLRGFGYLSVRDFLKTVFALPMSGTGSRRAGLISVLAGAVPAFVKEQTGLNVAVLVAFFVLIVAEFVSGVKASMLIRGERIKSRKMGRMFLKIAVYLTIVCVLHSFAKGMEVPTVLGLEVNPFLWLYYTVFTGIVFQLFISWMENLAVLGYKETKTLAGFILSKLNKYFEFDGTKDNGPE